MLDQILAGGLPFIVAVTANLRRPDQMYVE
jgi:hypothetical protein